MIPIIYRTGAEEMVSPKFLDILLLLGQVQMFKRADGWVVVGVDTLRTHQPKKHQGIDRRQHRPTEFPPIPRRHLWTSVSR